MSLIMMIVAVGALRLTGFVCNVMATQTAVAVVVLYATFALALAGGLYAIARGVVIEPPAFITQPITSLFERFSRRLAPST
jgi:lipopolysaccharide export system permease protein